MRPNLVETSDDSSSLDNSSDLTTLEYPDTNENDTPDEFDDFVAYNRRFVDPDDPDFTGDYTEDEVLHIEGNDTVNIWPDSDLAGKKIIFVEGTAAGEGSGSRRTTRPRAGRRTAP